MKRLIPKNTRVQMKVFRNFTLFDIFLIGCDFAIAVLLVISNLSIKWGLLVFWCGISVLFMLGDDDTGDRMYIDMYHLLKYVASHKKYSMHNLRKLKDTIYLVPFCGIEGGEDGSVDGIINYGTYYGAVLSIGCISLELLDEYSQNSKITALAHALGNINETTALQIVKIDRPLNYDDVSKRLFDKIEITNNEVKKKILRSRQEVIDTINNVSQKYCPHYYVVIYEDTKEELLNMIDVMRNGIMQVGLPCEMLSGKQAGVFFKFCQTRKFEARDIDEFNGTAEEYVAPKDLRFTVNSCIADGVKSFTCVISDFPLIVGNAWGAELFNIDNTKVVMNIKPVERNKAVKRIDRATVEVSSRQLNKASQYIDQDTHMETLANLLQSLKTNNEKLFDVTITITGYIEDGKDATTAKKEILRAISACGFRYNLLRGRQLDGYISAGISRRNMLRHYERGINSDSLAAIFPFVEVSHVDEDGIFLGYDYSPVILDVWKKDEIHTNSNMFAVGKSGAGKSFLVKTLLTNLYGDNTYTFIFDPENEYNVLCKNVGGKWIDTGNASEGRLNPLEIYQVLTDDGTPASPEIVYSAQLRLLEDFFKTTLIGISSDALEELNAVVGKLYKKFGIDETTDCTKKKAKEYPIFDDLYNLIKTELTQCREPRRADNLSLCLTYLQKFIKGGRYAQIWNGYSTLTSEENFVVFNFQSLFQSKNTIQINAQMLLYLRYLEQKIINIREQNRNNNYEAHPLIAIDEGYFFVNKDYPIALDFIREWYKRMRKYNGGMLFITQNLADIIGNAEIVDKTSAIINNSQYSFILGLAAKDVEALVELYNHAGGLNEAECSSIVNAHRGDCFAIMSPQERATFHIEATDTIVELFSNPNAMRKEEITTQRFIPEPAEELPPPDEE